MTGASNGKDPDNKDKIVKFPSLAERDRIRKKQDAQENEWCKSYISQNKEPFFNFGNIPPFTKYMVAVLIAIQIILSLIVSPETRVLMIEQFGFTPANFTGAGDFTLTTLLTPVTYLLIHGSWMHIGFNAIMGLALGTFVERMFSTPTIIKFFILCSIGGAALYLLINPFSTAPVIGASGSISGLFAAAIMMMVESGRMGALSGKLANKGPWPIIFIWAAIMTFIGVIGGGIAWEAHLGGFLTGAILYRLMRTEKLRL